jgi:hypothetical protein
MKVTCGIHVDDAVLVSTTALEPAAGETVYNPATTYAAGALVISSTTHRTYLSLQAANTGKPLPVAPATLTDWWRDVGPTNAWKMFDLARNTATVAPSPLTVVLEPGQRVDTIGMAGLLADEVTVTVERGGQEVYSASRTLRRRRTLGWRDYFFGRFAQVKAAGFFDLPPFSDATVTVAFTRSSGDVHVGSLLLGTATYLGVTVHNAESGALNFSKVDRNAQGEATLQARRSVPKTTQQVVCKKSRVPKVLQVRDELNAVPALWSGIDDAESGYFEALLIVGIYKRFDVNLARPDEAVITLELEDI